MKKDIKRLENVRGGRRFYFNGNHDSKPQVLQKGSKVYAYYSYDLDYAGKDYDFVKNIVNGLFTTYGRMCCNLNFLYDEVDRIYGNLKHIENAMCDIKVSDVRVQYATLNGAYISDEEYLDAKYSIKLDY